MNRETKTAMPTSRERIARRLPARCAAVLLMACISLAIGASSAYAAPEIKQWNVESSTTQAGGHPDIRLFVEFSNSGDLPTDPCLCDDARIVTTHMPAGLVGNPHATPRCTFAEFSVGGCPVDSQIGTVAGAFPFVPTVWIPMYNMETHPDQAGLIAFTAPLVNAPVFVEFSGRTESDFGLDASAAPIFHLLAINQLDFNFWGTPADPIHNSARFISPPLAGSLQGCFAPYPQECPQMTGATPHVAPQPYLQNPTSCGAPLTAKVDIEWYTGAKRSAETEWPSTTGCQLLSFNPSLTALPTTSSGDSASGLDVDVKVPQVTTPAEPAPSEIKAVTVGLPEGFSINPNAADGKVSCTESEAAFGSRGANNCPEFSKVGTSVVDSPALPDPIHGGIFIGAPQAGDRYRLFLTADGFGTHVKLPGSVVPDPNTGRISVSFPSLPQSPFSEFNMHFFGSERGLMATPTKCGTYEVHSDFVPWDNVLPEQHTTSYFKVDSGPGGGPCPGSTRPFHPSLEAGTLDNTAGRHAPLIVRVNRKDGDQNVGSLDISTPPGLLATLKGVAYCPEAALGMLAGGYSGASEIASPVCPATSRIGTSYTESGAGSHPLTTKGDVYLAGPYKGAPLSLVTVVPAVSGPYDLGNVVVRTAVEVDPVTARITAKSDPIPQVLEGIPLRLRSILIQLDRPDFTLNPTDCSAFGVSASVFGTEGATAQLRAPFQAANCANLTFEPKLTLKVNRGTKRRQHPALQAVLSTSGTEANIKKAVVTLPNSELLDQSHIGSTICTRVQFAANACPPVSVYGHATAFSPLLAEPLTGPVYLRSSSHKLPDLVAALHGQIDIDLVGRIDGVNGKLRTSFEAVPDAPVSKFVLQMEGGKKGLLQNKEDICRGRHLAKVKMQGQNGMAVQAQSPLKAPCGKSTHRKARPRTGR